MFHYTDALRHLLIDIISSCEKFHHIDLAQVGIGITMARGTRAAGVLAKCVPLRFEGGDRRGTHNGRRYLMSDVIYQGTEMLYLMLVYLPRFQNLSAEEKLRTLFHEMYHISPNFDGDLRRFPGPNYAHGRSREWFNALFEDDLQHFLTHHHEAHRHPFLDRTFAELNSQQGPIVGLTFPMPQMIPLDGDGSARLARIEMGRSKNRKR